MFYRSPDQGSECGQRIRGFDGLRAFSVIFVILTHAGIYQVAAASGWLGDGVAPIISGTTGVQIFFVLSGFLITGLLVEEQKATGTVSLKNFYVRRAFRILPLYFLCLALTLFIDVFVWPVAGTEAFWFAATFNTSFIPREWYSSILGHTWSLSVEEHFYIVWPAALLPLYRFAFERVFWHLLIGVAISLFLLTLLQSVEPLNSEWFLGRWSIFAGSWIALGCAAAMIIHTDKFPRAKAWFGQTIVLAIAVVLFAHSVVAGELPGPTSDLLRVLGAVLLIGWIVENQSSRLVEALEYAPLTYIGKISYGLYMWQGLMLATGPGRAQGQLWPLNPGLGLLLLCIAAPLSYHFFEKRFLSLSKAFRHTDAAPRSDAPTQLKRENQSISPY